MVEQVLRSLQPYFERIPSVERPKTHVPFKSKFSWTVGILILYFILSGIPVFGLSPDSIDIFEHYRAFFAGASGSILTLGIGPIVTASIILQLLVGAGIIKLDLTNPDDRATYQDFQRFLVFVMIAVEAIPQIVGGLLKPNLDIANALGVSPGVISFLIFLQLFIGGVLIVYMDEVVSKWGIGSGVSLFILAGISQSIIIGLFNWISPAGEMPPGIIPRWVWIAQNIPADQLLTLSGISYLLINGGILALITTIIIIFLVVFAEGTRVEIPLAHQMVRGARGRFPIKLVYTSVLPMIFVRALQANIVVMGMVLYNNGITFLGEYVGGTPINGLMYLLSPVRGPQNWIPSLVKQNPYFADLPDWFILLHLVIDATILIVGGILFAMFWAQTSGMDAKTVANQIARSGMQIPGFRKSPQILERFLNRYIPKVTILGGALIGLLTLIANMLGTIGNVSGTGLLLAVSIAYRLYEDLAKEQMTEMHPMLRRFLGEE
ncbi:protein translocase subunit secY/sec61 alpha [Archaeoglobus sulfaticallidus PM70-1]|uniref:Protein translocase subunit SecY n=1 Tax=Archaeoglobus sulfaticallidus PM70-1 TaxID=387631 RepID=N0BI66_9EURY|nr:preprotein translocase subunit SecY [Archaeoglobus sulfaticallidus]AGK60141.1 protein translocase subunit secY/sec61 alpha [Archaeoglobus sulfaticallidus PM70-1]